MQSLFSLLMPVSLEPLGAPLAEVGGLGAQQLGVVLGCYLLGSVPFGLLLGLLRGVDIRQVGSGNIGATNVGRALGRPWALLAFACDFLKGWAPSFWIAPVFAARPEDVPLLAVLAGGAATMGHVWPLYLRFRGGKGVATGCGAIVGIDPFIFLGGGLIWLVAIGTSRMVSLASLLMGVAFPLIAWYRQEEAGYGNEVVLGTLALTVLIFVRHRANMLRILEGSEPRIGKRGSCEENRGD